MRFNNTRNTVLILHHFFDVVAVASLFSPFRYIIVLQNEFETLLERIDFPIC